MSSTAKVFSWALGLVGLALAILILCRSGYSLVSYPWVFPDTLDWLLNGLAYAERSIPFEITHRALVTPLLMSLFFRAGAENFIPYLGTFYYVAILLLVGRALWSQVGPLLTCSVVVLLSLSYPLFMQSAYVGSDVLATLFLSGLVFSYYSFLVTGSGAKLIEAAIWAGIGIHSQYIEVILLPFLAALLVFEQQGETVRFSLRRPLSVAFSGAFWIAIFAGLVTALLVLSPRLVAYELFYSSAVTHVPLVHPSTKQALPYLVGLTGQLSIPTVLLAILGLAGAFLSGRSRLLALTMLVWIVAIGGFFVFLYQWFDCRFVIYITVPVTVLAGCGVEILGGGARRLAASAPRRAVVIALTTAVGLYQLVRPDDYTFSDRLVVYPGLVGTYNEAGGFRVSNAPVHFAPIDHAQMAEKARDAESRGETITGEQSLSTYRLFSSLRSVAPPRGESPRVLFVDRMPPFVMYFSRNRNQLYYRGIVRTAGSQSEGLTLLRSAPYDIVAGPRAILEEILDGVGPDTIMTEDRELAAVRVSRDAPTRASPRALPPWIKAVEAKEHPFLLVDGVTDRPDNWAASPLGSPLTITLPEPRSLRALRVHLYDFDDRRYGFTVSIGTGETVEEVYASAPEGAHGTVEVPLPFRPVTRVELKGSSNSETLRNPGNTVFHVKEIEILP